MTIVGGYVLRASYRERGVATTSVFSRRLEEVALAMPQMCCSMYFQSAGHLRQVWPQWPPSPSPSHCFQRAFIQTTFPPTALC